MRILLTTFLLISATQAHALTDTFYCLIQNFAGADDQKVHNYSNFNRFTMNIEREATTSDVGVIKFSNIFGPFSLHKNSAIHQLIKCNLSRNFFKIHGTGKQSRDFIYIDEVISSLNNGSVLPIIFNISISITTY